MESHFRRVQQIAIHHGEEYEKHNGAIVPPIYENSLFRFPDFDSLEDQNSSRYAYTRIDNPNYKIVEKKIAKMEKGQAARCFVSGVSAIFSALSAFLEKDAHVISVRTVYGRVNEFLNTYFNRYDVQVTRVEGDDIDEIEQAIRPNTKIIYLESPSSLIMKLQDLKAVAKIAKQNGIYTIIDNTWATPVFQNPLELGIDVVVHSVSKYLSGHSDIIGGVIVSSQDIMDSIPRLGNFLPPFEAWLLLRGLRTLGVRMKCHQDNALAVAKFLENHDKVLKVNYPGLSSFPQYRLGKSQMRGYSGTFSFELDTDKQGIRRFIDGLNFFALGSSWGGFESVISALVAGRSEQDVIDIGYSPKQVRISVGLEDVDCLLEDLESALKLI